MGDWKLIEFFDPGRHELYNLRADIGERTDLAREMPEKTKELQDRLFTWRKEVNAKLPPQVQP